MLPSRTAACPAGFGCSIWKKKLMDSFGGESKSDWNPGPQDLCFCFQGKQNLPDDTMGLCRSRRQATSAGVFLLSLFLQCQYQIEKLPHLPHLLLRRNFAVQHRIRWFNQFLCLAVNTLLGHIRNCMSRCKLTCL